jgi:hypothetical protein
MNAEWAGWIPASPDAADGATIYKARIAAGYSNSLRDRVEDAAKQRQETIALREAAKLRRIATQVTELSTPQSEPKENIKTAESIAQAQLTARYDELLGWISVYRPQALSDFKSQVPLSKWLIDPEQNRKLAIWVFRTRHEFPGTPQPF